ncbi:hypothetical protein BRC90_06625 [Halobacteriales archaeon QS_4_69_34]|nr:MAG: hypothetical protein BRC90_06625 [Halobacteriales archaeon QS_4_69_34]
MIYTPLRGTVVASYNDRAANGGTTVLLVDDEESFAELAATRLEQAGEAISVAVETSAAAGLDRLREEGVDCIVSDYAMPGMNGLEFLAAAHEVDPGVPFILFTGEGSEAVASEAISAGVTDYLRKDSGAECYELLANRVGAAVARRRAESRAERLADSNELIHEVQSELVGAETRAAIETTVCECLAGTDPYAVAAIGELEGGTVHGRASAGVDDERARDAVTRADGSREEGPIAEALHAGEPRVARRGEADADEPWQAVAAEHGCESILAVPLDGEHVDGVLAVYATRPDAFEGYEGRVLAELAGTVAEAIDAAETRAALERRERERRLFEIGVEGIGVGVCVYGADGRIVYANEAYAALSRTDRESVVGADVREFVPPDTAAAFEGVVESLDVGESHRTELTHERVDGTTLPVEVVATCIAVDGERYYLATVQDISERVERERELREERALLESTFDAIPDVVYAYDTDRRFLRWNDELTAVSGYTDAEIAEMDPLELLPPEDRAAAAETVERTIEGEGPERLQSHLLTKGGERIPYAFNGRRIEDETGALAGLVGVGRDVSERRRRERALGVLHETTRALMSASSRKAVAERTAAAAEEVLEFPITAIRLYDPGTDALEPVAVTDSAIPLIGERPTYGRDEGAPWRALQTESPVVYRDATGADTLPDALGSALYIPIGEHGTISIGSEVDDGFTDADIRLAELLAANAAAALDRLDREHELERYEQMVDTAGDVVYALDVEGAFTFVNDAIEELLGYAADELLGEHVTKVVDPEDVERIEEALQKGVASGDYVEGGVTYEATLRTADGETVRAESHNTLFHTDGELQGTIGIVRDLTERVESKAYRRRLYELTADAERSSEERVEALLDLGCERLGMESGLLTRIEDDTERAVTVGGPEEWVQPGTEWPLAESYCRRAIQTDELLAIRDAVAEGWEGDPAYETTDIDSYVGGSVVVDGELYGTFCFADRSPREERFSTEERSFVDLLVRGVSQELERRTYERRLSALHGATRELMAAETATEVAETACETAAELLDLPVNAVYRYDAASDALVPVASSATARELFAELPTFPVGEGLVWEVYESGESRMYDDLDDITGLYNPETPMRSEVLLPLGEHGVFIAGATTPADFSESAVSLAQVLGANTTAALDRVAREEVLREREAEVRESRGRIERLHGAATELVAARTEEELFELTVDVAERVLDFELCHVGIEAGGEIVPRASSAGTEPGDFPVLSVEEGIAGKTYRTGESFVVEDIAANEDAEPARETFRSDLSVPLGEMGVFQAVSTEPSYFDDTDRELAELLVSHATETLARIRSEAELREREATLERQNERLEEFASVLSHDLRNPLSVATGRLALAEEDCPSEHHTDVEWALDRMEAIVDDVLTLARQGKTVEDPEPVPLGAVVDDAWRAVESEGVALDREELGTVVADERRLRRLFENLFRNAVEHGSTGHPARDEGTTEPAGDDATVRVVALDEGGFAVADDGPGIPESERERIFEGGYSTAEEGTGLGLPIVRSLAEAHGWSVAATESEAGGARFEIRTDPPDSRPEDGPPGDEPDAARATGGRDADGPATVDDVDRSAGSDAASGADATDGPGEADESGVTDG